MYLKIKPAYEIAIGIPTQKNNFQTSRYSKGHTLGSRSPRNPWVIAGMSVARNDGRL